MRGLREHARSMAASQGGQAMSLPETCPFCRAGVALNYAGRKQIYDMRVEYECQTVIVDAHDRHRWQSDQCEKSQKAQAVDRVRELAARVAELEARCKRLDEVGSKLEEEKEAHAWEISPAMAQAKIDELNARVAELEARCKRLEEVARAVYLDSIASDHPWTEPEARNMRALRDVLEAKP